MGREEFRLKMTPTAAGYSGVVMRRAPGTLLLAFLAFVLQSATALGLDGDGETR